jgi:hypothetical protein
MNKHYKNSRGDVFEAKGDVFNAKGDVFNAKGDIFNAKGDVFNNAMSDYLNAVTSDQQSEYNAFIQANPDASDVSIDSYFLNKGERIDNPEYNDSYTNSMLGITPTSTSKKTSSGIFGDLSSGMDVLKKGVGVYNDYKYGPTGGINTSMTLGQQQQQNNTIWYVAGGVVVLLIVVGLLVSAKR